MREILAFLKANNVRRVTLHKPAKLHLAEFRSLSMHILTDIKIMQAGYILRSILKLCLFHLEENQFLRKYFTIKEKK